MKNRDILFTVYKYRQFYDFETLIWIVYTLLFA